MRKMFVILAILVASATSTFAVNPEKTEVFYKLNNEKVFNGLMRYLDTNNDQTENLKVVFEYTESKMKNAEKKGDDKAYDKAVIFNLANAKYFLSRAQYKKYLTLLNLSLNNTNYLALNER